MQIKMYETMSFVYTFICEAQKQTDNGKKRQVKCEPKMSKSKHNIKRRHFLSHYATFKVMFHGKYKVELE